MQMLSRFCPSWDWDELQGLQWLGEQAVLWQAHSSSLGIACQQKMRCSR
jgi:hypothetical protein